MYCLFYNSFGDDFYYFLFLAETYTIHVCINSETKYQLDIEQFPHRLIVQIDRFSNAMSIDMTLPKWAIFQIFHFLSDPTEISFLT